ncbi:MAG: hypothetical protein ACFFD1_09540, partial [Candidatus Thorarchaeota archaeon]
KDNNNIVAIDFGEKKIKIFIKHDGKYSDIIDIPNILYQISEKRVKVLKEDYKDIFSLKTGVFTKNEIENAQLLLQANEIFVNSSNKLHISKAYQNLFEILASSGFDLYTLDDALNEYVFLISIPFTGDLEQNQKTINYHISFLKTNNIHYFNIIDHLTASFYSQKSKIGSEEIKHPAGIVINISDETTVGILIDEPIYESYIQLGLGIKQILDHAQAILRDFNVKGFRSATIDQWLIDDGTCTNDAPRKNVSIRGKEINIQAILNTPALLFSYEQITGRKIGVNSIIEGIVQAIELSKRKSKKKLDEILNNVIVVGQGAIFRGIDQKIQSELESLFPDKEIKVIIGNNPFNASINGLNVFAEINPKIDAYNTLIEKIDDETKTSILKQYQNVFEEIKIILKEIKKEKILAVSGLNSFRIKLEESDKLIQRLPIQIQEDAYNLYQKEMKGWIKDLEKYLQDLRKEAENNLSKAEQGINFIQQSSLELSRFPNIVQSSFNQVLNKFREQLKDIISKLRKKDIEQSLKTLEKTVNSLSKNEQSIPLEKIIISSGLSYDTIKDITPDFVQNNSEFGFLDDHFVMYSEEILMKVGQFLNVLRDDAFRAIEGNEKEKAVETLKQSLEYCDFLINGYSFIKKPDIANRFIFEKNSFQNDLKDYE